MTPAEKLILELAFILEQTPEDELPEIDEIMQLEIKRVAASISQGNEGG